MEDSSGRESMMKEYCNRELRKWMTLVIQHRENFYSSIRDWEDIGIQ